MAESGIATEETIMAGSGQSIPGTARSWAELAANAVRAQVRLSREYADLARAVVAGDADRAVAGQAYLDSVRREGERFWRELSHIGFGYAADVVALSTRAGTAVLRDVDAATRSTSRTASEQPEQHPDTSKSLRPRRVAVPMRGAVGASAEATAVVVNRHPRARRITLTPGPLTAVGATRPLDAAVHVSLTTVTVQPHQEQSVIIAVQLDPEQFTPGTQYAGVVEVSGGDEALLELLVSVEPAG